MAKKKNIIVEEWGSNPRAKNRRTQDLVGERFEDQANARKRWKKTALVDKGMLKYDISRYTKKEIKSITQGWGQELRPYLKNTKKHKKDYVSAITKLLTKNKK